MDSNLDKFITLTFQVKCKLVSNFQREVEKLSSVIIFLKKMSNLEPESYLKCFIPAYLIMLNPLTFWKTKGLVS